MSGQRVSLGRGEMGKLIRVYNVEDEKKKKRTRSRHRTTGNKSKSIDVKELQKAKETFKDRRSFYLLFSNSFNTESDLLCAYVVPPPPTV